MSYWLWRSVLVGLCYLVLSLAVGDEVIAKAFDVRLDRYSRASLLKEEQVALNRTRDGDMWGSVKVLKLDDRHLIEIPRAGFLAWHATWCLFFLAILVCDRFKHQLCCSKRWTAARAWVAFAIMFLDLVITSFLNPSVARFMTFVYALLIRAQFVQTLALVFLSSAAMLSAGYVGSHDFLNSVSVAEFLVLNFLCLLASRQTEIHARLSLYRLWYIVAKERGLPSASGNAAELSLARNLLSLEELKLEPIPEDAAVDCALEGMVLDAAALKSARATALPSSPSSSGMSGSFSARSVGSREPTASRLPLAPDWAKRNPSGAMALARAALQAAGASQPQGSLEGQVIARSDGTRRSLELPPWPCLEGENRFLRSGAGDLGDVNKWAEVHDVERFRLRGKSYLEDKAKVPASQSAFSLHQARLFKTKAPLCNVAGRLPSLKAFLEASPDRFFIIYNRIVPYQNGTIMNVVSLLVRELPRGDDPAFDGLLDRFRSGGDDFRNLRLKHLSSMREAPSVVTSAIWMTGGEKPVILGKGYMQQRHYAGPNYLEVDVDISPSRTARMVVGKVINHATRVVMEEMLVIEGQCAEELPERPLAAWRWIHVNPEASIITLDENSLLEPDLPV